MDYEGLYNDLVNMEHNAIFGPGETKRPFPLPPEIKAFIKELAAYRWDLILRGLAGPCKPLEVAYYAPTV